RIEPFGWDRNDRIYFVLDDNRVYRLTEALPPPPRPKKNSKKARAQARHESKRRRVSSTAFEKAIDDAEDELEMPAVENQQTVDADMEEVDNNGLGGMKWECVAVSLDDLRALLSSISSKKDPNERVLHDKIVQHLLPILEQQDERRKKREKEREKELFNMAKMASAKRSSRIAGRQEQQRQRETVLEEEQKRRFDIEVQRKEEQLQRKAEKEREARQLTREKRLYERGNRRAQHEDELNQLFEGSKPLDRTTGRMSERMRKAAIEKNMVALRELAEEGEEEEWIFDCVCGLHGKVDDGQHSVSCENCNTWQHSQCLGIDEHEAEKDDFHFICEPCKTRVAALNGHANGRSIIRIKVNKPATESAAEVAAGAGDEVTVESTSTTTLDHLPSNIGGPLALPVDALALKTVHLSSESVPRSSPSVYTDSSVAGVPSAAQPLLSPPTSSCDVNQIPVKTNDSIPLSLLASGSKKSPVSDPVHNGHAANLFSLPRPELPQPDQSPRRSHAYGTIHDQATSKLDSGACLIPPSPAAATPASNRPLVPFQPTPCSFATPQLHKLQDGRGNKSAEASSSPLPSHGGQSPTKQSPTIADDRASVIQSIRSTPSVLPPTTALSPTTPVQVLTPPVKPEGLPHGQTLSGIPSDLVSQTQLSGSRVND
ncbi:hypothetical protein SEPCBS57363_006610, partial [Sporothrix epigloea]